MKKFLGLIISVFVITAAMSSEAEAAIPFGEKETIHKIVDVDLKGGNGEALYLGYKTHTYFLIAGLYVKDDGYVLGIRQNHSGYYEGIRVRGLGPLFPWELYRYINFDYQSPLKNFGDSIELGELEYDACIAPATEPMRSLGLKYENWEDVNWMVGYVGQRANLIQIICD